MRCRICSVPHKNTKRHYLWTEKQVCRICAGLLDVFSLNHNILKEYWNDLVGEKYG